MSLSQVNPRQFHDKITNIAQILQSNDLLLNTQLEATSKWECRLLCLAQPFYRLYSWVGSWFGYAIDPDIFQHLRIHNVAQALFTYLGTSIQDLQRNGQWDTTRWGNRIETEIINPLRDKAPGKCQAICNRMLSQLGRPPRAPAPSILDASRPPYAPVAPIQYAPPLSSALPAAPRAPVEAVGFGNLSANCWANTILQTCMHSAERREMLETVGLHLWQEGDRTKDAQMRNAGQAFLTAIDTYVLSVILRQRKPISTITVDDLSSILYPGKETEGHSQQVAARFLDRLKQNSWWLQPLVIRDAWHPDIYIDSSVSQNVRKAFHYLTSGIINSVAGSHEDAHEAMNCLLARYHEIVTTAGQASEMHFYMTTISSYTTREPRYELILRPPHPTDPTPCSIETLLQTHLIKPEADANSPAFTCCLDHAPSLLMITIGRFFGVDDTTHSTLKNHKHVANSRVITLPANVTKSNQDFAYELQSFIVHMSAPEVRITGGHYISYRKMGTQWVKFNDGFTSNVTPQEIDQILCYNGIGGRESPYMLDYRLVPQEQQVAKLIEAEQLRKARVHLPRPVAPFFPPFRPQIAAAPFLPPLFPSAGNAQDAWQQW